jgi:hypothetical protein
VANSQRQSLALSACAGSGHDGRSHAGVFCCIDISSTLRNILIAAILLISIEY